MNEQERKDYEKKLHEYVTEHYGVVLGRAIQLADMFGLPPNEISRLAILAERSSRERPSKYSLLEFRSSIAQYLDEQVKLLVKLAAKTGQHADLISHSAIEGEILFHHKGNN